MTFTLGGCAVSSEVNDASPYKEFAFFNLFQNAEYNVITLDEYEVSSFEWWKQYDDPTLNNLVDQFLSQNIELEIAAQRLIQAQEQINISQSSLFPTLSADASASRRATPNNNEINNPLFNIEDKTYNNSYNLGLSSAWQLDLFGELRNQAKSSQASYFANLETQHALVQSLIAQLVTVRLSIANINEEIKLIDQTINTRQKSLDTINRRYEAGLESATALDVRLSRENLAAAQAQLPPLQSQLTEQVYALNILLGEMPNQTNANSISNFPVLPPPARLNVPPPLALIDLRPDLRGDQYRLLAAKYDSNVAMANLYPSLSISANYGFQAAELGDLISAEKIAWGLVQNLTQPLFQGGRLRANIRVQEARVRELAAQYAQNILQATQEVENALQNEENLRQQLDALTKTNNEAQKSYDLAQKRYERGLLTITELLDIERRILNQKQQILNVQQAIWQSRVNLHLALGGQWVTNNMDDLAIDTMPSKIIKTIGLDTSKDVQQAITK